MIPEDVLKEWEEHLSIVGGGACYGCSGCEFLFWGLCPGDGSYGYDDYDEEQ